MTCLNTNQNTSTRSVRAAFWREAMGPGYQAPMLGRAMERYFDQGDRSANHC